MALQDQIAQDEEALERFRQWYEENIFFNSILDNVQREMARTHIPTSTIYEDNDDGTFHKLITDDFEKAEKAIKAITRQDYVLQNSPVIKKSIRFRNPFTYPLNMMQVELLDRWDEELSDEDEESLRNAIFLSINGIAAAMQSTG